MSRDLSHYFSCETYLIAYASGSRDGFVREHVDNCSFCEALVYGGTDEFPLSFEEEVAQVRAERQRLKKTESRRTFFKISAAAILGLATLGTTGVIASRYLARRTVAELQHHRSLQLDQIFVRQGRSGILAALQTSNSYETTRVYSWIGDNGNPILIDILVDGVNDSDLGVRSSAVQQLRRFNPSLLSPWKAHLVAVIGTETDEAIAFALGDLVSQIP